MSKVVIQGNASGTGDFTIAAPNSNTNRTLTLPDEAGTITTSEAVTAAGYALSTQLDQIFHVRDEKPSGTGGGTFTSGAWRTRTLNTVIVNSITGASLTSNQITLPAGRYVIRTAATAFACNATKSKLQNITDGVSYIGLVYDVRATGIQGQALGTFNITIAAPKVFELQHHCQTTRAGDGFGQGLGATTGGGSEVYSEVHVTKLG